MSSSTRMAGLTLSLSLAVALGGCAASPEEGAAASSDALVSSVRLDEVKPAELSAAASARFASRLAVLERAHPSIRRVSSANLGTFVETRETEGIHTTVRVDHESADAIRALFAFTDSRELEVEGLRSDFARWIGGQVPAMTVASGAVRCELARSSLVGAACRAAAEANALASAKTPAGVDMKRFVADWKEIFADHSGARFVLPVKLVGDPRDAEVKELAGVTSWCRLRAWGHAAVDEYTRFHGSLAPHAAGLKGAGIKKRWYWACGGDEWGEDGFAVLDEHDQLWAFTTFASE